MSSSLINGLRFATTNPTPRENLRRREDERTPASSHVSGTRPEPLIAIETQFDPNVPHFGTIEAYY